MREPDVSEQVHSCLEPWVIECRFVCERVVEKLHNIMLHEMGLFICLVYGKKQSERSRFTFLLPTTMAGGGGAAPASEAIARRRALQGKSGWVSSSLVDCIIIILMKCTS